MRTIAYIISFLIAFSSFSQDNEFLRKKVDLQNRLAGQSDYYRTALFYADSSILLADSIHYDHGLLKAYSLKGDIYKKQYLYNLAHKSYEQTLQLALDLGDTTTRIETYLNLGEVQANLDNAQGAEDNFRRALQYAEFFHAPETYSRVYTGLLKLYENRLNYDTLNYFLNSIDALHRKYPNNEQIVIELGTSYDFLENYQQSGKYFNLALQIARKKDNKTLIGERLQVLGDNFVKLGDHEMAMKRYSEALELNRTMNNYGALVGNLYSIGKAFHYKGDYEVSLYNLNQCLELATKHDLQVEEIEVHKLLAEVYEDKGDFENASLHTKLYAEYKDNLFNIERTRIIQQTFSAYEINQKNTELADQESLIKLQRTQVDLEKDKRETQNLLIWLLGALVVYTLGFLFYSLRREQVIKKAKKKVEVQVNEIRSQKVKIEKQRDKITQSNEELEEAQGIIRFQNSELKKANEELEKKVDKRTNELRQTYSKLSFHVNNTPLAVMEWNQDMQLMRWSSQASAIFAYEAIEVLGMSYYELNLTHKEDRNFVDQMFRELLSGKVPRNFFEVTNITKDGKFVRVEWSNSILFNQDGELISILSIANDVTSREKAIQDLKATNKDLDTFIYKASHDLMGPVARLQGLCSVGIMEGEENKSMHYFEMLNEQSEDLQRKLKDLLEVRNVHQHKVKVEEFNLSAELGAMMKKYAANGFSDQIDFRFESHEDINWKTDRKLLNLSVQKIIENAIPNHDGKDSFILLRAERINAKTLALNVVDNGVTYPKGSEDKVFELFFKKGSRLDKTGIGLYMAKKAVERLEGRIRLAENGKETKFEILLPLLS